MMEEENDTTKLPSNVCVCACTHMRARVHTPHTPNKQINKVKKIKAPKKVGDIAQLVVLRESRKGILKVIISCI